MDGVLVTKSKFAETLGVGKSAVSNWIERGIISPDAIVGEGRNAKINLEAAREQVRRNRDIGQSLGNGIATRTTVSPVHTTAPTQPMGSAVSTERGDADPDRPSVNPVLPLADTIEDQLKRAKLEEQLRRNRLQAAEEALRGGKLMSADDAREQMTRVAGMMMQIFEGALTDFAAALASQFDIPQRDALHMLKNEFRTVRKTATMKQRALAKQTPTEVTTELEFDA
ncbi:DNA-binding XRE family transcriptional regulator [Rubricella aquisinus]|uniref:DNA-binding XRE family transcriptional regulator n=1 Tax=Rubricella aquisinus TaxID=2028108 RepID=A0A840WL45_9RHOB|nr:hypothetical protein [Rubricella aquisinus]MBB5515779.1 DNA-binding XRE family transcriptional regulator [Rubricella aquisinus]